jgi:uncharacterized membrane protein
MARRKDVDLKNKELDKFKTLLLAGLWYTGYVAFVILVYGCVYAVVYHFYPTLLPLELYRNVMLFTMSLPMGLYLGLKGSVLKKVLMSILTAVPDGSSEN